MADEALLLPQRKNKNTDILSMKKYQCVAQHTSCIMPTTTVNESPRYRRIKKVSKKRSWAPKQNDKLEEIASMALLDTKKRLKTEDAPDRTSNIYVNDVEELTYATIGLSKKVLELEEKLASLSKENKELKQIDLRKRRWLHKIV
eukprot:CAMPEP_0178935734 /NCGR_PEP_ID=MMETSP0786-20121207/24724_1 /TAXON_ID=186022 /ORGANISM="Thalassionema frauenfeldii, Strain CCMP 1798" /LENGTH=144 /DNA_ID=CAMNT_0020613943 /DNA_START=354 /DNA_END=788 /DNA_ORIENTATION=-